MQFLHPYSTLAWRDGMEHSIVGAGLGRRRGRPTGCHPACCLTPVRVPKSGTGARTDEALGRNRTTLHPGRHACLATVARAALLVLGALGAPGAGHAQGSSWPGRIEILPVRSQTLPLAGFLRGDKAGPGVLLGGELRLPAGASSRVPAVILIHGSGGIGAGPDMWAHVLNKAGIAAFILDSFSGRGIVSTVEGQDQFNLLSMTLDAYRALDVLAAHPRIRPDRIAVWGFSKGAVPAVYAAVERFRASFGSHNRFAAHVGFYTPCNVAYDGDDKMGGVPDPGVALKAGRGGHRPDRVRRQPARLRQPDLAASGRGAEGARHAQLPAWRGDDFGDGGFPFGAARSLRLISGFGHGGR